MNEKQKAERFVMHMRDLSHQVTVLAWRRYKVTERLDAYARAAREKATPETLKNLDRELSDLNYWAHQDIRKIAYTLSYMAPELAGEFSELFLKTKAEHGGAK